MTSAEEKLLGLEAGEETDEETAEDILIHPLLPIAEEITPPLKKEKSPTPPVLEPAKPRQEKQPKGPSATRLPKTRGNVILHITQMKENGLSRKQIKLIVITNPAQDFWYWKKMKRSFEIDTTHEYLETPGGINLMYDINVTEPIELTPGKGPEPVCVPILYDQNCHYSMKVAMVMNQAFFTQMALGLKKQEGISKLTFVMILALVAIMMLFIGITVAPMILK